MLNARRWHFLVLAGLCWSASASLAVDPKLLPDNTEVVISINLKQILNSDLAKSQDVKDLIDQFKLVVNQVPASNQALKYLTRLGIDPTKDLVTMIVAHPATQSAEELYIIIDGNFNIAKIEDTAKDAAKAIGDGFRLTKVNDVTVFEVTTPNKMIFYVGLLSNKTVVVAGKQQLMKDAVARSTGAKQSALKKDVAELMKTINDKQSIGFAVSGRALAAAQSGIALGPVLPAVDGFSGSVTLAKEVTWQIGVLNKDAATARDLADKGNLVLGIVRTIAAQQAINNPDYGPLLDVANSLRLSVNGSNTIMTGEVSYENLQKMFKNLTN